ncbi:MAG: hypothetical protein OXF07_09220 [Rhodobacter sp.]|nr:hypothetical protein [Rhodobacter sp.]
MTDDQIKFGCASVPLLKREWPCAPSQPYRQTYVLKPGQSWFDADLAHGQSEFYALDDDGTAVPVGAMVAREMKAQGAIETAFVELWSGVTLVDERLICVDGHHTEIESVLARVREKRGTLKGFPDVIAVFHDGRVAAREIKRVGKDSVKADQHEVADTLRDLFGQKLDLAVVEWHWKSGSKA